MLRKTLLSSFCAAVLLLVTAGIYARESYEDYMEQKYRGSNENIRVKRDRPLSEIDPAEKEDLLDELRGAVREEIDQSIKDEKTDNTKKVNEASSLKK